MRFRDVYTGWAHWSGKTFPDFVFKAVERCTVCAALQFASQETGEPALRAATFIAFAAISAWLSGAVFDLVPPRYQVEERFRRTPFVYGLVITAALAGASLAAVTLYSGALAAISALVGRATL